MTKIAGAIVVLAGAIVFSTGLAILGTPKTPDPGYSGIGFVVGIILGLIGLAVLVGGFAETSDHATGAHDLIHQSPANFER